jgi:hypothetical protein
VPIQDTGRRAEAGLAPAPGRVGDRSDKARAGTVRGPGKAEVIHRRGPRRSFETVAFAPLAWGDGFNNRRRRGPAGDRPPAEAGERCRAPPDEPARAA